MSFMSPGGGASGPPGYQSGQPINGAPPMQQHGMQGGPAMQQGNPGFHQWAQMMRANNPGMYQPGQAGHPLLQMYRQQFGGGPPQMSPGGPGGPPGLVQALNGGAPPHTILPPMFPGGSPGGPPMQQIPGMNGGPAMLGGMGGMQPGGQGGMAGAPQGINPQLWQMLQQRQQGQGNFSPPFDRGHLGM